MQQMLNPDFLAHRIAYWYVLLDIECEDNEDNEDNKDNEDNDNKTDAYYEIYSDY